MIISDIIGDKGVKWVKELQTNVSIVNVPDFLGIQDWEIFNICFVVNSPLTHETDSTEFEEFFT